MSHSRSFFLLIYIYCFSLQAADQLAAMVGEELRDLSEANRQLTSLVHYGHYNLKQAVQ